MSDFSISYGKVMTIEGVYSNDSNDPGGETWKGISRVYNPKWNGWVIIDGNKMNDNFINILKESELLEELVKTLYKEKYWNIFMGDYVECQYIADELFDISVNIGQNTSIKFLQKALNSLNRNQKDYLNITVDGIFGKRTLDTLNNHPNNYKWINNVLNMLQSCYYINIADKTESQEKYLRGLLRRVDIIKV